MDSDSPPRKKLKQARLPFQILSHKDTSTDATAQSSTSRKRHLSEDSSDDVVMTKVGKKSEESKENETAAPPLKESDGQDPVVSNSIELVETDVKLESPIKLNIEFPEVDEGCVKPEDENILLTMKSEVGSILQNKMKSTLANLLDKKVFDVTAEVGACDCGCEDADSEEEAMKEYFEHCKNKKNTPKPSEKKSKEKAKRKSVPKEGSKQSSPAKRKSQGEKHQKEKGKSPKASNNSSFDSEKAENEKALEIHPNQSPKTSVSKPETERNGVLSQKAYDMFAKWRKGPSDKEVNVRPSSSDEKAVQSPGDLNEENDLKQSTGDKKEVKTKCEVPLEDLKNAQNCHEPSEGKSNTTCIKSEGKIETGKEESKPKLEIKSEIKSESSTITAVNGECREEKYGENGERGESPHKKSEKVEAQLNKGTNHHSTLGKNSESKTNCDLVVDSKAFFDKELSQESDDSLIILDQDKPFPLTPTGLSKTPQRRLTPKQIERQKEVARKQEEKEKLKLEKENEKKRLKQEKEELRRKEKEEKDEQRRKEKEEKEKKKQAELEQKNEEKRKKELLKTEEKRKKEEEKRKADEDKRRAEEEEERKKAKASALFTKFFVPKSSKTEREEVPTSTPSVQNFMPFEVKADMRMAPQVRRTLNSPEKQCLEEIIINKSTLSKNELYLHTLKSHKIIPKGATKTWPLEENKEDDDICILDCNDDGVLISDSKKVEKMRAKFLQFHENHRPAYRGTWRKKSALVTGRRPLGQEKILDYEVDSADEWEEEEPGESLHGSDDEKEQESEDEYEVDNSVFVPHGYLSDDEGDDDENEEVLSPETQKAKLKLLGEEFEAQMKSKTSALKPIIIVLTAALQASSTSARYQKLLERRAVWREDEGPIDLSRLKVENDSSEGILNSDSHCVTFSSGPGAKKKIISEDAMPALITLVHGNQNKRVFLTNEFSAFLGKSQSWQSENAEENAVVISSEGTGQPSRPATPSVPIVNPLLLKWPGLPPASRISISNKIKEIATWGLCPEEGPMLNRQCWYVSEEIRVKYGLNDMKLPNNQWHYTLKPKIFSHSHTRSPNAHSASASGSGPDSRALITKFTKVMTPEEKQRQWESMKSSGTSTPSSSKFLTSSNSTGKITAFTQQAKTPGSADSKQQSSATSQSGTQTSSSVQPQAKKRVPLLVSVPRGQQISSSHCSLLSRFEASATTASSSTTSASFSNVVSNCNSSNPSSNSTTSTNTSQSVNNAQTSKEKDEDCIMLD